MLVRPTTLAGTSILMWALCATTSLAQPPVTPPPSLRVDPFYRKYVDASGIPILSSDKVPDAALFAARDIVIEMLSARSDIREALIAKRWRVGVMARTEQTSDIPEHRNLAKPPRDSPALTTNERRFYWWHIGRRTAQAYWNNRARGLGGNPTTCAEENLLGYEGTKYYGENILVHEFAHAMMNGGIRTIDPDLHAQILRAYEDAMANGRWKGHYAATNAREYWAETAQMWFWSNYGFYDRGRRIESPDDLQRYDPAIYQLLSGVFDRHRLAADIYHGKNLNGPTAPPPSLARVVAERSVAAAVVGAVLYVVIRGAGGEGRISHFRRDP